MAADAGRGQRPVIGSGRCVALNARHRRMEAGQRECRRVVIERRRSPPGRGVAKGAIGGETGRYVVRIRGAVEVYPVAGEAVSRRRSVVIVCVALRARNASVLTLQRPVSVKRVIELRV